jgi:hypothetical protein
MVAGSGEGADAAASVFGGSPAGDPSCRLQPASTNAAVAISVAGNLKSEI